MLEPELCASRVLSPFREVNGDEELSVLPRHTKVIVTGNNRTKSVLVGLQGVVKKAVGLGGWHWLILKNGDEVKLQRNALSVLEPATGNEEDEDAFDNSSCSSDIGEKDNEFYSRIEFSKLSKPRVRYARPWISSASGKSSSNSNCKEIQSNVRTSQLSPSLAKLGMGSLWRYWRSFKLGSADPRLTREQVVKVVQQHFASQKVDEDQVILEFVHAAKRLKSADVE
ncbi:hypothetical protein NMG60_11030456 [Bertholletia excelsa]